MYKNCLLLVDALYGEKGGGEKTASPFPSPIPHPPRFLPIKKAVHKGMWPQFADSDAYMQLNEGGTQQSLITGGSTPGLAPHPFHTLLNR